MLGEAERTGDCRAPARLSSSQMPMAAVPSHSLYCPPEVCQVALSVVPDPLLVREVLAYSRLPSPMLAYFARQPLVLSRQVASANNEMLRFLSLAAALGRPPLVTTAPKDGFFPTLNPSKRRLVKLTVEMRPKAIRYVTVAPVNEMTGKPFSAVRCIDGTPLIQLHEQLLAAVLSKGERPIVLDGTQFWAGERPMQHYPRFFALFTCLGVLAESFAFYGYEQPFTESVILPAIEQTVARFGVPPRIVRLLPEGEELDTVWEHYPRAVLLRALRASRRPVAEAPLR